MDATGRLDGSQAEALRSFIQRAGALLRVRGDLRVRVIDDQAMRAAHAKFSGVDETTDVLTFDMRTPQNGGGTRSPSQLCLYCNSIVYGIDTDILVCIDEAHRQSDPFGYPVVRELLLYVVHGVLHCLGWDDHDEAESAAMHRLEDEVLTALGVGPVYARKG